MRTYEVLYSALAIGGVRIRGTALREAGSIIIACSLTTDELQAAGYERIEIHEAKEA